jgi:hypothetical protein
MARVDPWGCFVLWIASMAQADPVARGRGGIYTSFKIGMNCCYQDHILFNMEFTAFTCTFELAILNC